MNNFDTIHNYAKKNITKLDGDKQDKYHELLELERNEIEKQGAEQYWVDIIRSKKKFCTNKNCLVLPFLLGITNIDPLDNQEIIADRFSGKFDVSKDPGAFKDKDMPDIDLDFIPGAKDTIRAFASERYGADKVCSVGLWQTYHPRSALKDVAKSLGYKDRLAEIEVITKELPDEFDDASLDEALEDYDDFKSWYDKDHINRQISKYAFRLVGKIRAQGQHAGGLIISSVPLDEHLPVARIGAKGKERWTSEWTEGTKVQLSKFGFVKYDVLGLKTLQYIYEASKMIERNYNITIDWEDVGYDDEESFKTANELKTDSVFQFDTDVAKNILSKGGVKKLTDILVYTSLGRPGPMPMVDEYINRRDAEDDDWKSQEHPKVLELMNDTLGIMVFQEQVTSLLTNLAGFTIPEAERARKIMAKKWKDQLPWVRSKVLSGLTKTLTGECPLEQPEIDPNDEEKIDIIKETNKICGTDEWTWAKEYWKRLETFARYSFNRAHALSYSLQCYRCLYLKTHYPTEWWCAVLNSCNRDKQPKYIRIAKSEGISFGSININSLSKQFDVVDGNIVPGLLGIKGVGEKTIAKLNTDIRDINSLDDFVQRQLNNKTLLERLVHLGAFDDIHPNRKALWYWYLYKYGTTSESKEVRNRINKEFEYTPEQVEEIREQMYKEHKAKHPKSKKVPKRIAEYKPKPDPTQEQVMKFINHDYDYKTRLKFQKDFLGYHWDSPMDMYGYRGDCNIRNAKDNNGILECVVSSNEIRKTSKGNRYMTLTVTDGHDIAKIQIWSNDLDAYGEDFFEVGAGLCFSVVYNDEYKSFNLKRQHPIRRLPNRSEVEKVEEYLKNTEIFPDQAELEDDFLGDIE